MIRIHSTHLRTTQKRTCKSPRFNSYYRFFCSSKLHALNASSGSIQCLEVMTRQVPHYKLRYAQSMQLNKNCATSPLVNLNMLSCIYSEVDMI